MPFLHHLFGMHESKNAYDQVYEGRGGYGPDNQYYGYEQPAHHHKSSLTHEIIAGAAGFAGEVSIRFYFLSTINSILADSTIILKILRRINPSN